MSKPTPLDDDQIASIKKYHAMGYPLRKLRKDYSISFARLKKIVFGEYVTRPELAELLRMAAARHLRLGEQHILKHVYGRTDLYTLYYGDKFDSRFEGTFAECLLLMKKTGVFE